MISLKCKEDNSVVRYRGINKFLNCSFVSVSSVAVVFLPDLALQSGSEELLFQNILTDPIPESSW